MRRILAVALLCLTGLNVSRAEQPPDNGTLDVVASGVGKDESEATKDALSNAVRQAIGSFVSAETLVANDRVVRDQVLTASDGFVEKYEPVGKPETTSGGLISVTVRAKVRRQQLIERLRSAKVSVASVDGQSMFGQAVTKREQVKSGAAIVEDELKDIPRGLIKAEVAGEGKYDDAAEKLRVPVRISLDREAYASFSKRLAAALDSMGAESAVYRSAHHELSEVTRANPDQAIGKVRFDHRLPEFFFPPPGVGKQPSTVILCEGITANQTSSRWRVFRVPPEVVQFINRAMATVVVVIELQDREGGIVDTHEIRLGMREGDVFHGGPVCNPNHVNGMAPVTRVQIFPLIPSKSWVDFEYNGDWGFRLEEGYSSRIYPLEFHLTPDEVKRVAKAVCRVELAK